MALAVTVALLLAQLISFATIIYSCNEYETTNWNTCGSAPTLYSNNPAQLRWYRWNRGVERATLEIRKVDNAWSQTTCFNLGAALPESGRVFENSEHNLSSVDYDSLYVARLLWMDSNGTTYYNKDGDCFFTLQPTPLAPQNVTAASATSTSITWTWDKPVNHSNKVTHYEGELFRYTWFRWGTVNITTGTCYQWSGLSANTRYRFRVRAVTGSGNLGSWSYWSKSRTLPAVPSGLNVEINSITITSQSVVLTLSGCTDPGTVKYVVRYSFDNENELTTETTTSALPSLLTVSDLRPEKTYTFQTTCENSVGMTGAIVTSNASTLSEDTLRLKISSVRISDSLDSATVTWNASSAYAEVTVTGYDIWIVPHLKDILHTTSASAIMYYCHGQTTHCTVSQSLMPETLYTFQVRAITSVGTSPWSTPVVTNSTLSLVPPHLNGFTAYSPTPSSIVLSWNQNTATIEYYRLTLYNAETKSRVDYDVYRTVTSHTFHDLSTDTAYTVTIIAVNEAGSGPPVSVNVTTQGAPSDSFQPTISSVVTTTMSATIQWDVLNTRLAVTGYDILVLLQSGGTEHGLFSVQVPSHQLRVEGLMPETGYIFQVRALTGVSRSQWSTPVAQSTPSNVPPRTNGFAAYSPTPSSIALSWKQNNATIEYYRLTLHNAEANTTENYDLFRTVTSHTFHNLSPSTAYSLAIIAINKAGSGPHVSVNVTTQGAPSVPPAVSPLATATGVLGAMVVIGIVAVSLLFAYTCCLWMRRKKENHHAVPDDNTNCELQENVSYVTAAHNKLWSEDCDMEEEEEREKEEGCEEGNTYVKDKAMDLEPASLELPCRQYLQEKEKGQTVFASIPVFDEIDFKRNSGWYMPTVADAISMKLGMDALAFADLGSGVYFMCHRTKEQAKWVGLSPDLCHTLCGHFFQLYHKELSQLSPIEVELKFFSPLAADWDIQVWTEEPKELVLERAKKIVEFKTLKPLGLNNALKFTTKEMWEEFTSWFAAQRRKK